MKLFAKKSLGQHFLNSTHVLEQIISAAHIQKGESVLEIGPGTGVLTRALLNAGANVIAIEKDQRAVGMLEQDFFTEVKNGSLKIISGDVLDENILLRSDLSVTPPEVGPQFCIVANIPYYITGAILEKFLEHEPRPNRMVLLVQKEVAERICAHDKKESILSISVKAFGTPKIIARVPPGAFTPPPTVDSAILVIENISDALFRKKNLLNYSTPDVSSMNTAQSSFSLTSTTNSTTAIPSSPTINTKSSTPSLFQKNVDVTRFFRIVKAGFAHKRKFVTRNLETVLSKAEIETIWKKLVLDPKIRAEDMTVEEWVGVVKSTTSNNI